jgi:hypothetical protein
MDIDKLQSHKIEKFFHSESGERGMKIAGELLKKAIDDINNEMCDRFTDYLVDEYSLFYADRVRDGIIQQVSALLAGDYKVLERYKLKASDWGVPCDPDGIRRKIVQENADVIKDTYIQSLEEENERLRERIKVREGRY